MAAPKVLARRVHQRALRIGRQAGSTEKRRTPANRPGEDRWQRAAPADDESRASLDPTLPSDHPTARIGKRIEERTQTGKHALEAHAARPSDPRATRRHALALPAAHHTGQLISKRAPGNRNGSTTATRPLCACSTSRVIASPNP